jgi:hypothetical protein
MILHYVTMDYMSPLLSLKYMGNWFLNSIVRQFEIKELLHLRIYQATSTQYHSQTGPVDCPVFKV